MQDRALNVTLLALAKNDQGAMSDEITTDVDGDQYVYCETAQVWVLWCGCGPHEKCPEHLLNCLHGDWGTHPAFVNGQTADS